MESLFPLGRDSGFRLNHLLAPDGPLLHSHPYAWCTAWILSGGYTHEVAELTDGVLGPVRLKTFRPGETNHMPGNIFHRIVAVEPNTWTAMRHAPRAGERAYWVPGRGVVSRKEIDP